MMAKYQVTSPDGKTFEVTAPDTATQDQVLSYAKQEFEKQNPPSQETPANAGVANFLAGALSIPGEAIKGAANLGIAGYGVAKHELTGGTPPDLIQNFPGDYADWLAKFRSTGANFLNPDNPTPNDMLGTKAYQFTSRGGFIPGMALPAAGSMVAEHFGGPQWSGVGALAPSAALSAYNAARAPALAAAKQRNLLRDNAIKEGRDAGYKVPPSQTGGGAVENVMESVGGKAATKQAATIKNQQVTNALVRKAMGLPENTPLSDGVISKVRRRFAQPYEQVAALSPDAKALLDEWKQANHDANLYYKSYDRSANPLHLKRAERFATKAGQLERALEYEAGALGKPELIPALREARTKVAQTYDVERALNFGNGEVSANMIGRLFDQGKPLSGPLATIGRFAAATEGKFTGPGAGTPAPGVNNLSIYGSAGLGMGGDYMYGRGGAAAGLLPWIGTPVRAGLLSDIYQRTLGMPNYAPGISNTPPLEQILQLNTMQNQNQGNR